jgi:hypothetical protein
MGLLPFFKQTAAVLETTDGHIIKESLVILQYLEDIYPERPVARRDPCRRAASGSQRVVHGLRASLAYPAMATEEQVPTQRNGRENCACDQSRLSGRARKSQDPRSTPYMSVQIFLKLIKKFCPMFASVLNMWIF